MESETAPRQVIVLVCLVAIGTFEELTGTETYSNTRALTRRRMLPQRRCLSVMVITPDIELLSMCMCKYRYDRSCPRDQALATSRL
jgi:hypothetical protein